MENPKFTGTGDHLIAASSGRRSRPGCTNQQRVPGWSLGKSRSHRRWKAVPIESPYLRVLQMLRIFLVVLGEETELLRIPEHENSDYEFHHDAHRDRGLFAARSTTSSFTSLMNHGRDSSFPATIQVAFSNDRKYSQAITRGSASRCCLVIKASSVVDQKAYSFQTTGPKGIHPSPVVV
jgi:hypothetical protein